MLFKQTLLWVGLILGVSGQEAAPCYLPIDVMFLQDTTGSFVDDLPQVVKQIPSLVEQVLAQNPNSYFGVADFKDKPFYPLGLQDEYCYKLSGRLSAKSRDLLSAYKELSASGGGDLPEAQFQALISIAYDNKVGWRNIAYPVHGMGHTGAHLVIMSTDAVPHIAGDMSKYSTYPTVPQNLPPNSGKVTPGKINYECENQEYPTPEQTVAALRAQDIYLAVLTPDIPEVVAAWKWFVTQALGFPEEFVQIIKSDSSDLISGVLRAIKSVTETLCALTTVPPFTSGILPVTTLRTTTEPTVFTSVIEPWTTALRTTTAPTTGPIVLPTVTETGTTALRTTTAPTTGPIVLPTVTGTGTTAIRRTTPPLPTPIPTTTAPSATATVTPTTAVPSNVDVTTSTTETRPPLPSPSTNKASNPCECPEEPCGCEPPCKPELLLVITGTPDVEYHFTE